MELFAKLNYKGQKPLFCIHCPEIVEPILKSLPEDTLVKQTIEPGDQVAFVMFFATQLKEVIDFTRETLNQLKGDAVYWICYPKGTSRKYSCDFNRDSCYAAMKRFDMVGVRMVSIDDDWSAMRFRKSNFVNV